MEAKYIDARTDFGFKHLFGTELNKELLISFLNALLAGERTVKDLSYLPGERTGERIEERFVVLDVVCVGDDGERFVVEMQNANQDYYHDRSMFYAATAIKQQAKKGPWNYELSPMYSVNVLNFAFKDGEEFCSREVQMMDKKTKFNDKLTFFYIELPKFTKTEDELGSLFEKWVYVLNNLQSLTCRPAALQERVFTFLFEAAEMSRMEERKRWAYEANLKACRDLHAALSYEYKRGLAAGIAEARAECRAAAKAEGKFKVARNLKAMGLSVEQIAAGTGLTTEQVAAL